jgi:proteasome beta subunit
MALGILDSEFKADMSEDNVRELATRSIRSAIQRDAASGDGIDILYITKGGHREETISLRNG